MRRQMTNIAYTQMQNPVIRLAAHAQQLIGRFNNGADGFFAYFFNSTLYHPYIA